MTPSCKEFVLDDAMAITAIPLGNIPASNTASPVNQLTPTIDKASIVSSMLVGSITIGVPPAADAGTLIPIIRTTGKAQDDESDNVAGRLHTVTVNCQVDERDFSVWNNLLALERNPSHLILTFRDGTRAFVSSTEDAYLCTVDRDGAKTSVQFRIQNYMGIQMIG